MKKTAIILLSILVAGMFIACNQDVTIDAQTYANMELGTFVLNGNNYATLQAAIDALSTPKAIGDNDGVIYLTKDASGPGAVIDGVAGVKIDFGPNTYSFTNVTATQGSTEGSFGLTVKGGSSVTLAGTKAMNLFDNTSGLTMVYVEGAGTSLAVEQAPEMSVADDQFVFWAANGATLTIGGETKVSGSIAATGTSTATPKVIVTESAAIAVPEMKTENAAVLFNSSEATSITEISATSTTVVVTGTGTVGVDSVGTTSDLVVQNLSENSVTVAGLPALPADKQVTVTGGAVTDYKDADSDAAEDIIKNLPIFESGKGTEDDPYIIKTAAQLELFRDSVNFGNTYAGKFIRLDSDISLTGVWTPIGNGTRASLGTGNMFNGIFDGNGHTIKGLNNTGYTPVNKKDNEYVYGLFGIVNNAVIRNLTLTDVTISALKEDSQEGDSVAALIGFSGGALTVDNITIGSATDNSSIKGYNAVAGVVGRSYGMNNNDAISITNCTNYAAIEGYQHVAGVVGFLNPSSNNDKDNMVATVSGCKNFGTVKSTHGPEMAGVVCFQYQSRPWTLNITNNENQGTLTQAGTGAAAYVASVSMATDSYRDVYCTYDFTGNTNSGSGLPDGSFIVSAATLKADYTFEVPANNYEYNNRTSKEVKVGEAYMSLHYFASKVNNGTTYIGQTVVLQKDVVLTEAWTPIGNSYRGQSGGAYFAGTFDGGKKIISGLTNEGLIPVTKNGTIEGENEYVYGLFGVVKGATIKDVTLTNVTIVNPAGYVGSSVGAVVGYSEGSLSLTGCVVGAAENDSSALFGNNVGGVIGRAYGNAEGSEISITGCVNYANVTAKVADDQAKTKAAGIVGYVTCTATSGPTVTLENNKNYGAIESDCTNNSIISGIAVYGFQPDGKTASFTFNTNENYGQLTVGTSGTLAAYIASECYNGKKSGDTLTATGNTNNGSITGGVTSCNLVVATQNGSEQNTPEDM